MKFRYQARTEDGQTREGVVEAVSKKTALKILANNRLFVTSLIEYGMIPIWLRDIKIFNKVKAKDLVIFSRQLSMMFEANVPLVESLDILGPQLKNEKFKEKILETARDVEGGIPLSKAFNKYPDIFSTFYISMIRSGEVSGKLSESLSYLAERLEEQYELNSKIKGAMIYPLFVVAVSFGVIVMLIFFIMPQFAEIFSASEQELPWFTEFVLSVSGFLKDWLLIIVFSLMAFFGFAFFYLKKTKEGKETMDKHLLKIPFLGEFLKKFYLARFAQNLSTLIVGGLPIAQALRICSDIINNTIYRDIVLKARDGVRSGKAISSIFIVFPEYFPTIFCQMIATGEKTGQLDSSLNKVSIFFQKEVERMIDNILSVIEPILIVFLALIVGMIAAAVFVPLYSFIGGI